MLDKGLSQTKWIMSNKYPRFSQDENRQKRNYRNKNFIEKESRRYEKFIN